MFRALAALLGLLCASIALADDAPARGHRTLLGFVEWVTLDPAGVRLKARLDTGALTSSLHSVETETFERDGEDWVRFRVPLTDHREPDEDALQSLVLERPVARAVLIKRKDATPQRRYVVELPLCLDGRSYQAEFSLTDRSDFLYPVLLGRRFLADVAIVDPADSFLAQDDCDYTPLESFEQRVFEASADGSAEAEAE